MAEPDVSVVIPARDEARYVRGALASVAAQSWPVAGIEAVVVDNGSVDATAEVVRSFMAEERRLAVRLVHEPVPGLAAAKNRGVGCARGRWLIFLDADSRMVPDLVERVMARVRMGYPAGGIAVVADSGDWLDRGFFALMEFGKRLFRIRAQMFYCSRDLFERAGRFNEDLHLAEDSDLLSRLARAGVPICYVSESWIATSPRRLHSLPLRLGVLTTFARWALAHGGIGRRWHY